DPLARITFTLEDRGTGTYRVFNLKLSAGPLGGIHIKNPIFLIYSPNAVTRDRADNFSGVDLTVAAGQSANIGLGSAILTLVPTPARLAMAFQIIEAVNPKPPNSVMCKAYNLFS